ncbi:hypothetical protein A2335_04450 [Candidatus Peregrinibacteria bacterium RIFOXYB2_FULL_32_7]|nr:MAG: hypothetical protein A2335_04450 [Candidatus Peregrinibacteria bacterium RIFOXYB2_FULL_32_7]
MIRTANPALNDKSFRSIAQAGSDTMTIDGTVNKTGLLVFIAFITATFIWRRFFNSMDPASIQGWLLLGAFGGFIMALITIFKKETAYITAPIYAALEGLFIGGISATFEAMYPGIVVQAIALTFGVLFALLMAYKSKLISVTQNFRLGIIAATGGIAVIYLASILLGFFGIQIPLIHESGTFGILFSLIVVIVAALNLVLDFDFIEHAAEQNLPKYMEWYGAFGLMVTLVWLYIEILRLLAKLRDR